MPLGFRQGHAAVRNAQLVLARERAILREMELQVVHDLSNSVGDVDRSYIVAQTNYNRRVAAAQQMAAVQAAFEADTASLLDLVESQRRLADADSRYARSMVEYTLAVKNVMFESNTLLENNGINMAEGPVAAQGVPRRREARFAAIASHTLQLHSAARAAHRSRRLSAASISASRGHRRQRQRPARAACGVRTGRSRTAAECLAVWGSAAAQQFAVAWSGHAGCQ